LMAVDGWSACGLVGHRRLLVSFWCGPLAWEADERGLVVRRSLGCCRSAGHRGLAV
jgi:hypothetical protein